MTYLRDYLKFCEAFNYTPPVVEKPEPPLTRSQSPVDDVPEPFISDEHAIEFYDYKDGEDGALDGAEIDYMSSESENEDDGSDTTMSEDNSGEEDDEGDEDDDEGE